MQKIVVGSFAIAERAGVGKTELTRAGQLMTNKSIDTDVLSAGVARLLSAGQVRR